MTTKQLQKVDTSTIQIATANDLLINAQWPHLAINEQRLVLYMLSLIKRGDKDFTTYRISIRELGNILGIKHKNLYNEFDKAADGLMTKVINFIDPEYTRSKKEVKVTWCSYAARIRGEGYVEMRFDPALKPFLLALQGNFTLWGDRRSIIRMKSHYSLRIYQLIKYNQGLASIDGRKSTVVELSWLREFLAIPEKKYPLFANFKSRVLIPSQKDIRDKTDIEFDFTQIKKGRKVYALEFTWRKNKRFAQQELPGLSDKTPVRLEEILTLEFGITPEKKAQELVQKYDSDCIDEALVVAREYIEGLQLRGQKVSNVGGIARKAIEEGWRRQKSSIEIDYEEKFMAIKAAKVTTQEQIEAQEAREQQLKVEAVARYEQMAEREKEAFLDDFRAYIVEAGDRIVLERFDEKGISPVPVAAMFGIFARERLLGKESNK